ncbi:MAG: phage terminase small subunit P27 family [candidate division WOR-3 bacterium]|nr:MAG: phage terminase small subunit P27 family [candidate division WOR-3 bacterium]
MSKGRKPKPTALHKAQGTYQPVRHANKFEADGTPSAPTIQSANETFEYLVKKLDDLGVVAEIDAMALQMLADAWEDYQVARNVIKEQGPTYSTTTAQGDLMWRPRPEVLMMNQAWTKVEKMMVQFGLTASSRAKISVEEKIQTLDDLID